ncbi:MAG: EamA family transporter [Desulfamplus sp.]|nr:EamA family transporter [Desulfamplus sp.]
MQNFLFYTLTVLIWGSTWIAIKMQLGVIDPVVSVAYRFTLASVILLLWCYFRKMKMNFTFKEHIFIALQGTLLFALNYWLFYLCEIYLTSGLAAVIFSTIIVMNMVNGAIFLKKPFDLRVIIGGILGLCGISLVFKPELSGLNINLFDLIDLDNRFNPIYGFYNEGGLNMVNGAVKGIVICFAATILASLGNIVSARNQKHGLPVIQTNAYGMTYGAILMISIALFTGKSFDFVVSIKYISALIYLSIFGSIVAFGCYLSLIGRIGPDRAAYSTLLFPIVALIISTVWEGYHWSNEAIVGVILILSGNLMMVKKPSFKALNIKILNWEVVVWLKNRYKVSAC